MPRYIYGAGELRGGSPFVRGGLGGVADQPGADAFAPFAKLPRENSRVTVTGGTACRQRGAKVKMVDIGTCSLTVTNKDKKVRLAVRI